MTIIPSAQKDILRTREAAAMLNIEPIAVEMLIYELAADGIIKGELEKGVFHAGNVAVTNNRGEIPAAREFPEPISPDQLQKLTNYKGATIPEFEVGIIKQLEAISGKDFVHKYNLSYDNTTGFYTGHNRVTSLNIYRCGLKSFPEIAVNLQALSTLELGHNQIKEIPGSIKHLKSLRKLSLPSNLMEKIPVLMSQNYFLQKERILNKILLSLVKESVLIMQKKIKKNC